MFNKDKFSLASLHTAAWLLVFLVEPIVMSGQKSARDNLYEPNYLTTAIQKRKLSWQSQTQSHRPYRQA